MPAVPRRPASCNADTPRAGLAVGEFLVAFAVLAALAILLIPASLPHQSSTPAESRPPRYMLRDALLDLQLRVEHGMIDAYESCFHGDTDKPAIVDIHPGRDTAAAGAAPAEGDRDAAS
jgi:hypothetical protein